MTKYKRWILLLTALTISVANVESLKATSLIHPGKFPKVQNLTTTSTTEKPSKNALMELLDELPESADEEVILGARSGEKLFVEVNGTKIALTGIPQIDYVFDPNLPRELNGFNLSSYPFLDSMPADEDLGFDCDGKINGYYASIKYGCQLYHHCLYGVRNNFICANFTAFDQKTFICHFASEVDCKNSYKYWNRNEDLYKATTEKSTTAGYGLAPLIDRNLYARPGPGASRNSGSQSQNNNPPAAQNNNNNPPLAPLNLNLPPLRNANNNANNNNNNANNNNDEYANPPAVQRSPNRPFGRPTRRRRPPPVDYYYYEDEYEDEPYNDRDRRPQQRPRDRRPVYDDYDNRRPYSRRPASDDFDDYEYERRPYRNRNRSESRRNGDGRRKYEDRRFDDRRRPYYDDRKENEDRKRPEQDERRSYDNRRERYPDRNERVEQSEKREIGYDPLDDDRPVKPTGSIFDRQRPSPKINRPVPKGERNRNTSKSTEAPISVEDQKKKDDEYYEEYDDLPVSSSSSSTTPSTTTKLTTTTTTTTTPKSTTKFVYSPRLKTPTTTKRPSTTTVQDVEYYDDEYYDVTPSKPAESSTFSRTHDRASLFNNRNRNSNSNNNHNSNNEQSQSSTTTQQPSTVIDNFKQNRLRGLHEKLTAVREQAQNLPYIESTTPVQRKPLPSLTPYSNNKKFANQQTLFEPTTTETPKAIPTTQSVAFNQRFLSRNNEPEVDPTDERDQKSVLRVVKRPFLPSRGGSPYKGRGLQPVGPASVQQSLDSTGPQFTASGSEPIHVDSQINTNHESHLKNSNNQPFRGDNHKTTLEDIYNEEYDVELNDALNPMLKPLTSSRGISGFSFSSLPIDDGYRSQSQKSIQRAEAPKKSTTTTTEAPQYEYEEVEYDYK